MAAEVKNAANVVSTGRTNLDTTKGWVESMVSSLPATSEQDRERKLIPIAREGINKVNNIVNSATDEMRTIQGRVTGYKGEYEQLTNQKFAPGGDKDGEKDEEQRSGLMGEEGTAEDSGRAEEDVRDTIEGDPQAADRVAEVINSLTDDQLNGAEPLSDTQKQVLDQIRQQTSDMSIQDVSEVDRKLGENKGLLTNAFQVLSDPDVKIPLEKNVPGPFADLGVDDVPGGKWALPDSVRETLESPAIERIPDWTGEGNSYYKLTNECDLRALTEMVAAGDERFQNGSYLDGGLMSKATEILDASSNPGLAATHEFDGVMQDIFKAAGRDEIVNHELLTGNFSYNTLGEPRDLVPGDNGAKFLDNLTRYHWEDNGVAARTLTDWIDDSANGRDPVLNRLAGESAHRIADYLGDNRDQLMRGIGTPGTWNPDLIRGYAEALAPYQESIIGDRREAPPGFDLLDGQRQGDYSQARNIFEILNGDPEAAKYFNSRAYEKILEYQQSTSELIAEGRPPIGSDLGHAGRMLGVLNEAVDRAGIDTGYDLRKDAIGLAIGETVGKVPILGSLSEGYLTDLLLPQKTGDTPTYPLTQVQNLNQWVVASALFESGFPYPEDAPINEFVGTDGKLQTPEYILEHQPGLIEDYYQALFDYSDSNKWGTVFSSFDREFDQGTGSERGRK